MMDELTKLRADLAAAREEAAGRRQDLADFARITSQTIDDLKTELAAKDAEIERLKEVCEGHYQAAMKNGHELAAHQLVIQQMRDWFVEIADVYSDEPKGLACVAAKDALALQPNQEALEAYVREAVEKELEECVKVLEEVHEEKKAMHNYYKVAANMIRARKDKQ